MRIGFIGDIVGRPGREMVQKHLKTLRVEHALDIVIANYENASHGFGLSGKNAQELLGFGIDVFTGGNHSFDKKDIIPLLALPEFLRPINYPSMVAGSGCGIYEVAGNKLAVINAMGHFAMPHTDNVFAAVDAQVTALIEAGIKHIFIDMHAEATSEKRALFLYLKERISLLIGTHTHVGCDDAQIIEGCGYLTDVGLTGCRDNVIGMEIDAPIARMRTGLSDRFEVPKKCKAWLQMAVCEFNTEGRAVELYKIRRFDDGRDDTRLEAYFD